MWVGTNEGHECRIHNNKDDRVSSSCAYESLNNNHSKYPYDCNVPVRIPDKCPKKDKLGKNNCKTINKTHGYIVEGTVMIPNTLRA